MGKNNIHGDWAIIKDKNLIKIEALDKKIGEIENKMNDTDKDGVPDYLDQENNSVAGVAVDSRGRSVMLKKPLKNHQIKLLKKQPKILC